MTIYVESNFVLELVFSQEQHQSCNDILAMCQEGRAHLVLPAYSVAEPYEKLIREKWERKRTKTQLDTTLTQIRRNRSYEEPIVQLEDLANALLIGTSDEEALRLEQLRSRLLSIAEIIPLHTRTLQTATHYQNAYQLSPQDAIIYASVIVHLQAARPSRSCFLNANVHDFDDPGIIGELNSFNCKLLPKFDAGFGFIRSSIAGS